MDLDRIIDKLLEGVDKTIDTYVNELENDFTNVLTDVTELYYKEINKIYNSFIEQYYDYPTDYYIRHWETRPGTRKGSNLYYGNRNKLHKGKDPYWEINYDGSEMADDYEYDSADKVLTNVIFGIRGVPPYWQKTWYGKYKSRYFNYKGSLLGAYTRFINDYPKMMTPVFMRRWKAKRKGKSLI